MEFPKRAMTILFEWWDARPRLMQLRAAPRLDLVAAVAVSAAAAASVLFVSSNPLVADGTSQLEMARSLATTGTIQTGGNYSHFYPPLYPMLLVVPGLAMGFNKDMVHFVQAVLFGLIVLSTFFVGRGFSRPISFLAMAMAAFNPVMLEEAGQGRATLMAALLMLWSFHFVSQGLRDERKIGWAGIAAGLLYLTKDTTGFVAFAGIAIGALWRVRTARSFSVLGRPHYLLAGFWFGMLYGAWALRNEIRHGTPLSNIGVTNYVNQFFGATPPEVAVYTAIGATALLALHWLSWAFPALADPRVYLAAWRNKPLGLALRSQALAVYLLVTVVISGFITAVFILNEGNKYFPGSMPDYYRMVAISDPLLALGLAAMVCAPNLPTGPARFERALTLAKVAAVVGLLISSYPAVAARAEDRAAGYKALARNLFEHGDMVCYSEATLLFEANLPRYDWRDVTLDFTGPYLDYVAAGVPDGATIVSVGWSTSANFTAAGFSVFRDFNRTNPPVVHNPFFEG